MAVGAYSIGDNYNSRMRDYMRGAFTRGPIRGFTVFVTFALCVQTHKWSSACDSDVVHFNQLEQHYNQFLYFMLNSHQKNKKS